MSSWFVRCIFLFVSAALQPDPAAAAVLRGSVTDGTGAVVPGASVRLLADGRVLAETTSDTQGEFVLDWKPGRDKAAEYTILAVASGFAPTSQPIPSAEAGRQSVALVLDVAPYRQSLEIQTAAPTTESLLDMSGVRESPAKDLGEALTALDGVWKIRKAGIANDLVVRGFQQNNINVLVDGSRTYGACPSHMDPAAQHVDFAEVDRVEVNKGAFDVTNQGSLGALVNIITRRSGPGLSLKPSFSVGSFGYLNPSLTAGYGNRVLSLLGGYSFRTSEPYRDGAGRRFTDYAAYSASGRDRRSFEINTGWLSAQVALSERQRLSLAYTRQQAGLILYPYLTMDADYDNADRATFSYTAESVTPVLRSLRVEGYFTQVKHLMTDKLRTSAVGGNWMMAANASSRAAGGRLTSELGRDFAFGVESYSRNWKMLGNSRAGGQLVSTPAIPDVDTITLGAFLTYQRALSERVRLTAGARYDHAAMRADPALVASRRFLQFHNTSRNSNNDNYASGHARLSLALRWASELYFGAGTTGRIPDAEERYLSRGMSPSAALGNPLLPITRNTELALGWSLNQRGFYLRPALFYSFLNDYILVNNQPQAAVAGTCGMVATPTARSYANVDARLYGGELNYGATLARPLTLSGGVSYTRGVAAPKAAANALSPNLPEMPPARLWSTLRYARRWAYAELGGVASTRQNRVSGDLRESPTAGYALLNARLGLTWRRLSASFAVDNLLDRFHYEHLSYFRDPFTSGLKLPEPGRSFFTQLRYSF